MTEPAITPPEQPWHEPVRLEDVPDTGLHLEMAAGREVCTGLAALAGVVDIQRAQATFDVMRHGEGLRARGRVCARVVQTCVVTLEPIENEVDEPVDVVFSPSRQVGADAFDFDEAARPRDVAEAATPMNEPPEPLTDGTADLGALAAEFLMLGIDPYPRKEGAAFTPPADSGEPVSPFAALLRLHDRKP